MAPVNTSDVRALELNNGEWPVLAAEPEWELVGSSAKDIAFHEFPLEAEPPSWAARLAAQKENVTKATYQGYQGAQFLLPKADRKRMEADMSTCQVPSCLAIEEDSYDLPDSKQLARELRSRQAGRGGGHTLRSKGHCPIQKSSNVSVVEAGAASPEDVSQVAEVLRQMPVREVVKHTGGTYQQVKTREGRQAAVSGGKMYDVTVPVMGTGEDDVEVTYRVIEDGRGGTSRASRNPKGSGNTNAPTAPRNRMHACPQTKKQTCKKDIQDIQEGMNLMGFN